MKSPNPTSSARAAAARAWPRLGKGALAALASLAVVLTLGLLAYSALGSAAGSVGIGAAFATVVAGGLVYALLGTAASPTGGPSSATALILAGLVAKVAHDPLLDVSSPQGVLALVAVASTSVLLMGLLQVGMGLAGLGRLARYVPQPVLAGFMNGVALLIVVSQLPTLLGLASGVKLDAQALTTAQPLTLLVGLTTAGIALAVAVTRPRLPASLLAMGAGSALFAALHLGGWGAALGPTVGALPQGLVLPLALAPLADGSAQALLLRHLPAVVLTAAVLALIGALESLLSALATDQLARNRHDPQRELMSLGAGNIASGLCGGLPLVLLRMNAVALIDGRATGRGPLLACVAAFALMFLGGGPLLALLPKTVLAGVMLTIALSLVDRWTRQLLRQTAAGEGSAEQRLSLAVVAAVCITTMTLGFVAAVAAGLLLAVVIFIRSMNRSLIRSRSTGTARPSRRVYGQAQEASLRLARPRVVVLELEGALFFGSAERLAREAEELPADCAFLVLDLARVSTIDETGAVLLQQLGLRLPQRGTALMLGGVTAENPHGRRLRAFGVFDDTLRAAAWPDADRALEAAERALLAAAGESEPLQALALTQTSLLHGLDEARVARVSEQLRRRELALGESVFRAGDPGDSVYVLTLGSVSIVGATGSAGSRLVSFSAGAMFGEIALLAGGPRSAHALADSPAVVHELDARALHALAQADPGLGEHLMRNIALHLADRLRNATSAAQGAQR